MEAPRTEAEFVTLLCRLTIETWRRIREYKTDDSIQEPFEHLQYIMDHLVGIHDNLMARTHPGKRFRSINSPIWLFRDWDPASFYGGELICCFSVYERLNPAEFDQHVDVMLPGIENAKQEYAVWREGYFTKRAAEALARRKKMLASLPPAVKRLPHAPDHHSMTIAYERAEEYRPHSPDPTDEGHRTYLERYQKDPSQADWMPREKDDLTAMNQGCLRHADQAIIRGFVGYYLGNPLDEVRADLLRGCSLTAFRVGAGAHHLNPWEINDWLHIAMAVGHRGLAEALIGIRVEAWNTRDIRPANWLILRLRIVMDLWRGDERQVSFLLEQERVGIFIDRLPEELEPDLPEMRNVHHLLKALAAKDAAGFNARLAERMAIRASHYIRGGTVAPIACIDVHGLALCRLARDRGITPTVDHVYLPYGIMDLPPG